MPDQTVSKQLPELTPAEKRRQKRIKQAKQLYTQGWTQKNIAQHLSINPKTVRRYLQSPSPQTKRHRNGRLLDAFKPYILKRWNEGCHNATQLYREIQPQGYAGKITIVRDFVRQLRQISLMSSENQYQNARFLCDSHISLRSLTWFVVKHPDKRSEEDEAVLTQISQGHTKLTTTIELARDFAAIVRDQQAEKLNNWLQKAHESKYRIWNNFAASLNQDFDAVRAALSMNWSNGPTEGHVNRLKCVKRQMYGRAKDDLLRKRILWQGRWSFT